ncbi:MAG: hypothetical protein K8S56_07315 [Candidatus Cloacimonetes bacterium]|nr:hypothetical protein [Candidatus Cloacimonadota bacterium]
MGYKINYDIETIATGVGIKWKRFGFDYSFLPYKEEIDTVHSISLSYRL